MHERIKELRKLKGLNQKDFGSSINISQNHISGIEKGVRGLTTRTINDICRVYNVNPNWIINGTGDIFRANDKIKESIQMFSELDDETQKLIIKLIRKILDR